MKKSFLTLFLAVLMLPLFSQSTLSSILDVTQSGDNIVIAFNLPDYSIKDTSVYAPYEVSETFKFIDLEHFGYIDDIGYPQLPQLTVDLHVPTGAFGFQVVASGQDTENVSINRRILPSQEDYELDSIFQINENYYNSSGDAYNFLTQISESYIVFGATGISFSVFPFTYNPQLNEIIVLNQATFTISYSVPPTSNNSADSISTITGKYLSSFFENYAYLKNGADFDGRYLMITSPRYENTLTYFANYKRNLGYEVDVVSTAVTGTTKSDIKDYLQTKYDNKSTRPDFVLLVGDYNDIPASGGNTSGTDIDDPITDLNYTRLDGSDFFADVFLGRYSVSDSLELQNIINKTIYMEMNIHLFEKKAKFLAGAEDNGWMQNQFEKGHNYVIKNTFKPEGYDCQKLYQPNTSEAVAALNDNPLFYIYSGHGNTTEWVGGTFRIRNAEIAPATNSVYPFVFAFACKTGNFAHPDNICIGERWIRNNRGGVTYFGSSVSTGTISDKAIEKKIFGDDFTDNERISEIINLGMKNYWKRFWSLMNRGKTRRYMKAYNLLGDPSLNILGTGCIPEFLFANHEIFNNGDEIVYHASNSIQNNEFFFINNGADVTFLAGHSIVLKPGFEAKSGAEFRAGIEPCDNGASTKSTPPSNHKPEKSIPYPQKNEMIVEPALFSIFPNPVGSDISLSYNNAMGTPILLEIFNISGVKVKTLLDLKKQDEGVYYYNFSISDLHPGIYLLVFTNSAKRISSKIIKK